MQHPVITTIERTGYPEGYMQPPLCPVCDQPGEKFYEAKDGEIVGCDICLKVIDALDYMED